MVSNGIVSTYNLIIGTVFLSLLDTVFMFFTCDWQYLLWFSEFMDFSEKVFLAKNFALLPPAHLLVAIRK